MRRLLLAIAAVLAVGGATAATAHTDADLVAVGAGAEATVTLAPTHGCGDSPTVEVSIRAPVPGATAGPVAGWTASATPDDEGNTVLHWTGGSLPADVAGEFPVTFTAPDTVGELLTFPAVQRCADGQELAWIDGDPDGEFPAPRLLVLPAGSAPAATLDDVPADAPGRDQLTEIVDVDDPSGTTTTTSPVAAPTTDGSTSPTTTGDDGNGNGAPVVLLVAAAGAVVVAGVVVVLRRRARHVT